MTACTLAGNSSGANGLDTLNYPRTTGAGRGGGIANLSSSNAAVLQNTLIAQNKTAYYVYVGSVGSVSIELSNAVSDVVGQFVSTGYNLIGTGNGSAGLMNGVNGDLVGTTNAPLDPRLGPLQDNGGPTLTHALLAGSPAIDAGTNGGWASDQRGQPRTIDDPAIPNAPGGDGTDIGALEVNPILTATELRRTGSDIRLRFTSVSDKTYGVQFKSEANGAVWTDLPGIVTGTGGCTIYTDTNAANLPHRFYRAYERAP